MQSVAPFLSEFIIVGETPARIGRPCVGQNAMTGTESKMRHRRKKFTTRLQDIAMLDFETDPFDNQQADIKIFPFACCLYSDQFEPLVIWDEHFPTFIRKVLAAIEALPRRFTIYAHSGGKFDFMFMVSELRGPVKFKGRGIMVARVGNHELRDSFHIIPEKLASYKKDDFDYSLLKRGTRQHHRKAIIEYMTADCVYLFDLVRRFITDHGFKISIGQAATAKLRQCYKIGRFGEVSDRYMRQWFFGGRVECLMGAGHFVSGGPARQGYKLYDVNSMYPAVMANQRHPVSSEFTVQKEGINDDTVFLHIRCDNYGAFVRRNDNNETSANDRNGDFFTTIWEYRVAEKYGLMDNVTIIKCIDFRERTTFADFVLPIYAHRQSIKEQLQQVTKGTRVWDELKISDIFDKLILNNAYGKQAQNPRKYKDHYITGPEDEPPETRDKRGKVISWGDVPKFRNSSYAIWERPSPGFRFNNVATAASITGAARAVLLEAIQNADDPIYCDTDSLICRNLRNSPIHKTELGAWDIEKELSEIIVVGKKSYGYKTKDWNTGLDGNVIKRLTAGDDKLPKGVKDRIIVRWKGGSSRCWVDLEHALAGDELLDIAKGPTLTRYGRQTYMRRILKASTPKIITNLTYHERVKSYA